MVDPSDGRPTPSGAQPDPAARPDGEGRGSVSGSAGDRGKKDFKPTPVRAFDASDAVGDAEEVKAEEREVAVEGSAWVVRVLGRARGDADVPLLLLGLWPAAGESPTGTPEREVLVVGKSLADLPEEAVVRACDASRPWRPLPPPGDGERSRRRGGRSGATKGRRQ